MYIYMYVHTCTYLRLLAHYTPKIAFNVLRLRVLTDATEVGDDVLVAYDGPLSAYRRLRRKLRGPVEPRPSLHAASG